MSFFLSFARGSVCISKIKSTLANKIYRAARASCASNQPNVLFLGIARSDLYKPITSTPMIGQIAGYLSLCPAKTEFPL